ncbi:MAG: SEC-C metal-binding domain-containing protein [Candidatus Solibacter sp.]
MIFPPESVNDFRLELEKKLEAGSIDPAEAFRQALTVDPNDPLALRSLAVIAEETGDRALAADYARRAINANPVAHDCYLVLGRVLPDPALAAAYAALGKQKLHFYPVEEGETDPHLLDAPAPALAPGEEPEAVTRELEPHRLLHQLFAAGLDAVEPSLVDRILARGADIAPLLMGVLNAFGEDLLDDADDGLAARALALLGEIGDPAFLPALHRFTPMEDEAVGGAARWAFLRIARRHPQETLAIIKQLSIGAAALDLATLAQQLCMMPETPGRDDVLLGLADHIDEFDKDETDLVLLSMFTSAFVMHGADSEPEKAIEAKYGSSISRNGRKELRALRAEIEEARQEIAGSEEPSIYDVCVEGFDAVENGTFEHEHPKVGRNDPCWCGSGKKYKKCHLDSDEHR